MTSCSLLSLATAVPPHVIAQAQAKLRARDAFGGKKALFDRLSGVFDNAGIAKRHIVTPPDWYMGDHGWLDRNNLYLEASEQLFVDAATAAIEKAGLTPDRIDGVVTVSTTGIATPSLEARTFERMGFRPDIRRIPLFGLGCAGGVNGLATASRLAAAEPGSHWLMVTVETCSISIRLDSDDPAAVVATTVAFALLHVPLYGWHVVPLDLAVGLGFAGLRLSTRTVLAPIVAHAVADLATWWL